MSSIKRQSRRDFFLGLTGFTGAGLLAPTIIANALADIPLQKLERRRLKALNLRNKSINRLERFNLPDQLSNRDEVELNGYIANFTKGLPHNSLGEVAKPAYDALLKGIRTGKSEMLNAIPLGGKSRLANPSAANAFTTDGSIDSCINSIKPFHKFSSEELAGEYLEVLWQALLRDVPFLQLGFDPLSVASINDLRRFTNFNSITPENLFRGNFFGDNVGPYVSQFLYFDVPYGSSIITQKYRSPKPEVNHMTDYASALAVLNGQGATTILDLVPDRRYITTLRDLAEYVRTDFSYEAFLNAALILLKLGTSAVDSGNPYLSITNQGGFVTLGSADILELVARVSKYALMAAWFHKWNVHRAIRPEVFSLRLHNNLVGATNYPINEKLLQTDGVFKSFEKHGTYLLPMSYPDGCPLHPSYTSGHATIAGACVTVLKAFFNEDFVLPNTFVPDETGSSLVPYTQTPLTVGGELNKLASNIGIGRNLAGVHWRIDAIEGMKLGEKVAIEMLRGVKNCYSERGVEFNLTRFDGKKIII
jgi:hypothetical protein